MTDHGTRYHQDSAAAVIVEAPQMTDRRAKVLGQGVLPLGECADVCDLLDHARDSTGLGLDQLMKRNLESRLLSS